MFEQIKAYSRDINRPILITGHTGFKGAWLSMMLEKLNVKYAGISLAPENGSLYLEIQSDLKMNSQFIDIRNREQIEKAMIELNPWAVLHLAAQPLVIKSYVDPIDTFSTNVMGTAHLLDICLRIEGLKTFIAITTDKVYENLENGKRFREDDSLKGKDPYSASKVAAESAINAWQGIATSKNSAMRIISARAGNVIGGGDRSANRLLPDLVNALQGNEKIQIRNPKATRPWQHVLDPIFGYMEILEKSLVSDISNAYNFGPDENSLSVEKVLDIAISHWGPNSTSIEILPSEYIESGLLEIDSNRAKADLMWTPKINQKEAIERTIDWWKAFYGGVSATECMDRDLNYWLSS